MVQAADCTDSYHEIKADVTVLQRERVVEMSEETEKIVYLLVTTSLPNHKHILLFQRLHIFTVQSLSWTTSSVCKISTSTSKLSNVLTP